MLHPHQCPIDWCNEALASVRSLIPIWLYREVDDDINRFDEWGVGMELLIDELGEIELKITPGQFDAIHKAMSSMGQGECDRLEHLRQHGLIT